MVLLSCEGGISTGRKVTKGIKQGHHGQSEQLGEELTAEVMNLETVFPKPSGRSRPTQEVFCSERLTRTQCDQMYNFYEVRVCGASGVSVLEKTFALAIALSSGMVPFPLINSLTCSGVTSSLLSNCIMN